MISEPEMAEDFGPAPRGGIVEGFDAPPARDPRTRRPWVWALGGVLAASAVWAGGLYAYGIGHHRGPGTRGYTIGANLCKETELTALSAELGTRDRASELPLTLRQHVLDRSRCFIALSPRHQPADKRWTLTYEADVSFALHRKTDPRAEFEGLPAGDDETLQHAAKVEEVPGLGDEAYLVTFDDGDPTQQLKVLDGGAVFVLALSVTTTYTSEHEEDPSGGEPKLPDLKQYESAMISDLQALMVRLKS